MVLYTVEMLRWGDRENRSYVIGVYSCQHKAGLAGKIEETWRGGKYTAVITAFELDAAVPEDKLRVYDQTV